MFFRSICTYISQGLCLIQVRGEAQPCLNLEFDRDSPEISSHILFEPELRELHIRVKFTKSAPVEQALLIKGSQGSMSVKPPFFQSHEGHVPET